MFVRWHFFFDLNKQKGVPRWKTIRLQPLLFAAAAFFRVELDKNELVVFAHNDSMKVAARSEFERRPRCV